MIHLAADHAGYSHKEYVKAALIAKGFEVTDHGASVYDEYDDYPDVVTPCAHAVVGDPQAQGIVFGGSGQGEAMCANRISGVRAVPYYGGSREIITLSRAHNNANILSLGARFISESELMDIVTLWLETPFSGDERHTRRLGKF